MSDFLYTLSDSPDLVETREMLLAGEKFLADSDTGDFKIDCSRCALVTSITLGMMVRLHNMFSRKSRQMLLTQVNESFLDTLRSSSLIHILKIEQEDNRPSIDIDAAIVNISLEIDFELVHDIGIFKFSGSMLSPADTDIFYNMAKKILEDGHRMLLDMYELVYIGSMGLGSILRLHKIMNDLHKGEIRICSPGEILKDMLDKQSLTSILNIYDSREEALKGWI